MSDNNRYVYNSEEDAWVDTNTHRFCDAQDVMNDQDRELSTLKATENRLRDELTAEKHIFSRAEFKLGTTMVEVSRLRTRLEGASLRAERAESRVEELLEENANDGLVLMVEVAKRQSAEAEVAKWKFMLQFISERTTTGAALVESAYQNYAGSPRLSDAELKRRLASDGYNRAHAEEGSE